MNDASAKDIRRAAMDLLARREHSQRELQQKLALRFSNRDLIDNEIERLRDERLQSDKRYAEVYLFSRAQRLYGPMRIRAELRERGITEALIVMVFKEADIDWSVNLRTLEANKFGVKPPVDMKEKAKRLRFFQYRGFAGISVDDDTD